MRTFEELYREHVQSVFRFAMRMTGNREEAEDPAARAPGLLGRIRAVRRALVQATILVRGVTGLRVKAELNGGWKVRIRLTLDSAFEQAAVRASRAPAP